MATYPGDNTFPEDDLTVVPLDVEYEDWIAFQATSLTSITPDNLDPNIEYEIQVRAVTNEGMASDWTDSIYFTTPDDVEPPAVASTPVVVSKLGGFSISWDGLTEDGGTMPPDFAHLNVYASGTLIGVLRSSAEKVVWPNPVYGTTYLFTFVSEDTSGNVSTASASASSVAQPVVGDDLIGKIIDGTVNIVDGTIYAPSIAASAITASKIAANAITAGKISAGAIDGMEITGNVIRAGTIYSEGRTAYNDGVQGWYITSDGYANVLDSAGKSLMTLNPRAGSQYFQIGDQAIGAYLKYDISTGTFRLTSSTGGDVLNVTSAGVLTATGSMKVNGTITTGTRTALDDNKQGWIIGSSGYANVNDYAGNRLFTLNPNEGQQYFQIGDQTAGSGDYVKYSIADSRLGLYASTVVLGSRENTGSTFLQVNDDGILFAPSESWDGGTINSSTRIGVSWEGLKFYTNSTLTASITNNWHNGKAMLTLETGLFDGIRVSKNIYTKRVHSYNGGVLYVGGGVFGESSQDYPADGTVGAPSVGFGFRDDSTATFVKSYGIAGRSYTGSGNVVVSPNGELWQGTSSATKYKVDIEEFDHPDDTILELQPKTWIDRGVAELLADGLTKTDGNLDKLSPGELDHILPLERIPGLIAEEVHEAGLTEYVRYKDGEPEGLEYDRLWVQLIPTMRRQRDRINDLEQRLAALESA